MLYASEACDETGWDIRICGTRYVITTQRDVRMGHALWLSRELEPFTVGDARMALPEAYNGNIDTWEMAMRDKLGEAIWWQDDTSMPFFPENAACLWLHPSMLPAESFLYCTQCGRPLPSYALMKGNKDMPCILAGTARQKPKEKQLALL